MDPHVGRLYHLAILAPPDLLQQLFYYCKSLGVREPSIPSRESTLTDPIKAEASANRGQPVEASFVDPHMIAFSHIEFARFGVALDGFLDMLDNGNPRSWKVRASHISTTTCPAVSDFPSRCKGFT